MGFPRALSLSIILIGQILAAGCGSGKAPDKTQTDFSRHPVYKDYEFGNPKNLVRLGIQPLYSPTGHIAEVMKRDRILRRNLQKKGFAIRFYPFLKGFDVNHFLRRGDLDAGVGGDMPALTIASDSDVRIVSLAQYGPTSLVTKDLVLLSSLKGRRIAFAKGSNAHFGLLSILTGNTISPEDFHLIPMEVSEMPSALARGSIDAFSAWEPVVGAAVRKYGFKAAFRSLSAGYLYFSKRFMDSEPEIAREVLAAHRRAVIWLRADRAHLDAASEENLKAYKKLTGDDLGIGAKELSLIALQDIVGKNSRFGLGIPDDMRAPDGKLFKEFEFLKSLGKISKDAEWAEVRDKFDNEFYNRLIADPNRSDSAFDYDPSLLGEVPAPARK